MSLAKMKKITDSTLTCVNTVLAVILVLVLDLSVAACIYPVCIISVTSFRSQEQ